MNNDPNNVWNWIIIWFWIIVVIITTTNMIEMVKEVLSQ